MRLEAMESATDLMRSSLTLQANLFQLFQPMGGVLARPLSQAKEGIENVRRKATARNALRIGAPVDLVRTSYRRRGKKINLPAAGRRRVHRGCAENAEEEGEGRRLGEAGDEKRAGEEEDGRSGEGDFDVEGTPESAYEKAGSEVADSVHGGESAEGHAVLFARDKFGGEGIFKGFFGADVETREDENQREQPERMRGCAEENRGDSGESITGGENGFAVRDMIAEPAAGVGGTGVENIVQRVENDGETRGGRHAASGGKHLGGVENQERVGEIAGAENADSHKEAVEGPRQGAEAVQKGFFLARFDGPFANEQPETGDGDESRKQSPEKHFAIGMRRELQQPEGRERADDGAEGVHEAFEAEGATVSFGRRIGGEKSFASGRAHASSEPGSGAAEEHVIGMRGESERGGGQSGERVTENGERLAALQAVGVMAGGKFCEAGEAVGDSFDGAEPDGTGADDGEKGGKDGGGGFVGPIGEKGSEADAEDGAVEPGRFGRGRRHRVSSLKKKGNGIFTTEAAENTEKRRSGRSRETGKQGNREAGVTGLASPRLMNFVVKTEIVRAQAGVPVLPSYFLAER